MNNYLKMKGLLFKSVMLLFLTLIIQQSGFSQKRIMIQAVDVIEGRQKFSLFPKNTGAGDALRVVPPYCINFFANNKNFTVIDRQNLYLIDQEKDLQKSESFIDGYIVDQGKSEGADYVLKGIYIVSEKTLSLKIYDIAGGSVLCSTDEAMETSLFGVKNFESRIHNMLHQLLFDCFDIKFSVVRILESKKDEARFILGAVGKKHRVKIEDRLEIFTYIEENIDGEIIKRKELIGDGKISEIQDENFSKIKVNSGGREIQKYVDDGKKLYMLINNKF